MDDLERFCVEECSQMCPCCVFFSLFKHYKRRLSADMLAKEDWHKKVLNAGLPIPFLFLYFIFCSYFQCAVRRINHKRTLLYLPTVPNNSAADYVGGTSGIRSLWSLCTVCSGSAMSTLHWKARKFDKVCVEVRKLFTLFSTCCHPQVQHNPDKKSVG